MKDFIKKYNILKIIRGILVFLLFNFSFIFQYFPLIIHNISVKDVANNLKVQVLLSTFSSFIVSIILLLIYRKELIEEFKKFKSNGIKGFDSGFKCWIVGLVIMFSSNIILAVIFKSGGANNENIVQSLISALPIIMGIDVCLLAPFNEEIVFRKTLYDVIKDKRILVSASFLLFGLAHVVGSAENIIDWLYIIPYGALGGAFALAYKKTDTVFTSMTLHMIHNTAIFLLSVLV